MWDIVRHPETAEYLEFQVEGLSSFEDWKEHPNSQSFWRCVNTTPPTRSAANGNTQRQSEERAMILEIVAVVIELLRSTGVDHEGNLLAWCIGTAEVKVSRPSWSGMLKDGQQCATFAILSSRCSEYEKGSRCQQGKSKLEIFSPDPVMMTRIHVLLADHRLQSEQSGHQSNGGDSARASHHNGSARTQAASARINSDASLVRSGVQVHQGPAEDDI